MHGEFDVSNISNEIEITISIKIFQGLLHINMLDGIEIKNLLMARTCKFKYTYDFEEAQKNLKVWKLCIHM